MKEPTCKLRTYLVWYNMMMAIWHTHILYKSLISFRSSFKSSSRGIEVCVRMYDEVGSLVKMVQLVALLEVVHAMLKVTPSKPLITAIQLLSRNFITCAILGGISASSISIEKEVVQCLGTCGIIFAWTLADLIRYLFYTMTLLKRCPAFLEWLRYSLFIVLYPLGVAAELNLQWRICRLIILTEKGSMWRSSLSLNLPNRINTSIDVLAILILVLFVYTLLFPTMYSHMLAQRKRKLDLALVKKSI